MAADRMTEAEAEAHMQDLLRQAETSSGKIVVTLSWTPQQHALDTQFFDDKGDAIGEEAAATIELNPFLPVHVLVWALRFEHKAMMTGATQLLQIAMQGQALQDGPAPGSPEAVSTALDRIREAAAEARGKSDIIAT